MRRYPMERIAVALGVALCLTLLVGCGGGTSVTAGTWINLHPAGALPLSRDFQAMVFDASAGKALMFGGETASGRRNDLWAYDPAAGTWSKLHPSGALPSARSQQSLVFDSSSGQVLLFGGFDGRSDLNDLWAYDPSRNTWTKLQPSGPLPEARLGQSEVYDSGTGQAILFGGSGASGLLNDTWAYDPAANRWTNLSPSGIVPEGRSGQAMLYDPANGKVLMFGGEGTAGYLSGTWLYDPGLNRWRNLNPSGTPPARDGQTLAYDPASGQVILFGGFTGTSYLGDTWAYDSAANTWTKLRPPGGSPAARDGGSLVYDPDTGRLLLFGGLGIDGQLSDIWAYTTAKPASG